MTIEIRVPQLPESVADATLVAWHKQPGDAIKRDENLADLETDKVVLEVPAPTNGVLRELKVESGTTVTSGQVLAIIEEGGTAAAGAATTSAAAASAGAAKAGGPAPAAATTSAGPAATNGGVTTDTSKLSPSVRRLVEENKLDPAGIPASGRDGRLTKADVVEYLDKQGGKARAAQSAPAAAPSGLAPKPSTPAAQPAPAAKGPAARPSTPPGGPRTARAEQRVPMTRLRQRIASRMVEAQSTQALLTSFNEVDLTAVNELRAKYKDRFEKTHGVKLGFMSFFVKASIEALKKFPIVNATVDGTDIVYHEYYDIGVAVSTDRGLMVPVIRDADTKSFGDIEKEIAAYAAKAREGTIAIEDLTGGTFTITNGGVFGSLMSTPIVNAPQSAILGMHKIQERPMVVNGQIAIRPMMYLAVTYDHRIIDGREAVQFLVTIKDCLEDPGRMLLQI
ncbi:MAG TPA: 2-oxoglutarate dehydrogenase complex dihydrolipoyllysine-residue succinyltransferase [Steroidobacteraceae bacterium]|nr:2-oxoglutarate dehydrogenase complex dihydrolipoyllysine-residue succinyltransferase [Steroidobacteraceae bacterium]